mmetsp:Transcript_6581/g.8904  ORF Transcript_6581/g.8904 Transcript_6581/m.8904 type:complete len:321 (+) Transcript_6581:47-1009(+)
MGALPSNEPESPPIFGSEIIAPVVTSKSSECLKVVNLFGNSNSSIKVKACLLKAQSKTQRERVPSRPNPELQNRKRSVSEEDVWGWFEELGDTDSDRNEADTIGRASSFTGGYKETPEYIIEESLSSQALWHDTAGKRPKQPEDERAYFLKLWEENFRHSEVPSVKYDDIGDGNLNADSKIIYKGISPFTSQVAKHFQCQTCGTTAQIIIHIPKYRVIQEHFDIHAEYLVVIMVGEHTFGVWRRYTEFKKLAEKLASPPNKDQYRNSLCSWKCLRNKRRWYRCLDKEYLALKCFMLQRFLQDLIFESLHPSDIRDFLGIV